MERSKLVGWLLECLDLCGDFQGNSDSLSFLASKIVADVEAMYPGFATLCETECAPLGWGSRNGLSCVDVCTSERSNIKTGVPQCHLKFIEVHRRLRMFYLDPATPADMVAASGWQVLDGQLVSSWGNRAYSITDTEHILCKLWLVVMRSSSCRNISKVPKLSAPHCYPLRVRQEWEELLTPVMGNIVSSFVRYSPELLQAYPSLLLFPEELEWLRKHQGQKPHLQLHHPE